jgi:hypothetical protein
MRYEHTQVGYLTICVLFGVAILVAVMGLVAPADRHSLLIAATIEVILLVSAIGFNKLTTKVDGEIEGLLRDGTHLQEGSGDGDCGMRINPHPLVVRLGNSSDAAWLALQCFRIGRRGDHVAQRPKIRLGQ